MQHCVSAKQSTCLSMLAHRSDHEASCPTLQVATTDISDRSAQALDRAAVLARQAAMAPAPSAQAAAVSSAGAPRTLLQVHS